MKSEEAHAVGVMVVSEVELEPEIAASENEMSEDDPVSDGPGSDDGKEQHSRDDRILEPLAMLFVCAERDVANSER